MVVCADRTFPVILLGQFDTFGRLSAVCRRSVQLRQARAQVLACLDLIAVALLAIWVAFPAICIQILRPMSQHPSLKGKGAIKAKRSVLKRFERVEVMKKRGQFKEGQRVIGLPKTKPEE